VVYFHAIDWKVSPKYVSYALMSVVNDTENISKINFEVTSVHVLKQLVLFLNLKEKLENHEERDILKGSIDMCKMINGTIGNFVVKNFLSVKNNTNFNFKCPVAANTWYARNFQAIDDSFIPVWLIGNNLRFWEVDINFRGKVGAMKSLTWFGTMKINGTLSTTA
jgi:Protein of unknown function (DUF1091)